MKILLKNRLIHLLSGLCILLVLLFAHTSLALAQEDSTSNPHIYDDAGLLSTTDKESLEKESIEYGKDAGIDMIVLTHDDSSAKDGVVYIEDFYDSNHYKDCVILLIDMANRKVVIEGYGTAETYIHSKRGDVIREAITPDLTSGNYFNAIETFFKDSDAYMKDDSELNTNHDYNNSSTENSDTSSNYDASSNGNSGYTNNSSTTDNTVDNILQNIWFQLLVSLIIGGIVVGTMAANSGGRMTAGSNNYIDEGNSGLIGRRDDYIRTTVTRVKKPTQNNTNSGGFSGGISSGGSSHSTSSGSF